MNVKSRFYARRMMFAARRSLLRLMQSAVWEAHLRARHQGEPHADERLREFLKREDMDADAEAYYVAREMAHWAHLSRR